MSGISVTDDLIYSLFGYEISDQLHQATGDWFIALICLLDIFTTAL